MLKRLIRSVRQRGLKRTVARLPRIARRAYAKQQSEAFDQKYGVRTAGSIATPRGIGTVDSRGYEPISLDWFRRMMSHVDVPLDGYQFVDVGCGLGRAMMLAGAYSFEAIVGIEYQESLVDAGRGNMDQFCEITGDTRSRFTIVQGDAATYEWVAAPTVVFLYNPFGADTMARVLEHAREVFAAAEHDVWIVYRNPVQRNVWDAEQWLQEVGGDEHYAVWRSAR
ncbi:MAG: putative RNA methylase [Bradymonadia bacterium]|jgi:predicted RNA methylase